MWYTPNVASLSQCAFAFSRFSLSWHAEPESNRCGLTYRRRVLPG